MNNQLSYFYTSEGRVTLNGAAAQYEYALKDHLGNSRVWFSDMNDDGVVDINHTAATSDELIQEEHYYPFGLRMSGSWEVQTGAENAYQYSGKELIGDFGLGWSDFGARAYLAEIGRWNGVDELAEKYMGWSGYNYVLGNPLKYVDPDGMRVKLGGENSQQAVDYLNEQFKGRYTVSMDKDGYLSMVGNEDIKLSDEDMARVQTAAGALEKMINDESDMAIGVESGSDKVDIGSYNQEKIDIADIKKFDAIDKQESSHQTAFSGLGKIMHEMEEQYQKQIVGAEGLKGELDAHNAGIDLENLINGTERTKSALMGNRIFNPGVDAQLNSMTNQMTQTSLVRLSDGTQVDVVQKYTLNGTDEDGNAKMTLDKVVQYKKSVLKNKIIRD